MIFNKKNRPRRSRSTANQPGAVYSYYSNNSRSNETSSEQRLRQYSVRRDTTSKWRQHSLSLISAGVIVAAIGFALTLTSNPVVVEPHSQNSIFLQDSTTYQKAAGEILGKSILNNNKVTINTTSVTNQLKRQFPELSDVSVTLPIISRRPLVYIVPSQPTLIISAKNGRFILNEKGVAVLSAANAKGLEQLNLPVIADKSNISVKLGQTALPAYQVAFIKVVNYQLKQGQQRVKTLTLPAIANQLDIQLEGTNYYVKMDMQGISEVQAGALLAVLEHLNATKQVPASYIDVRVEGRAYYK
jgi:hypothetical protein